jgi:hypothetical protein
MPAYANTPGGPNLFLVGAPKCGTTSLYEYLRVHPEIFFPHDASMEPSAGSPGYWRCKEPAFFCTDLDLPVDLSIKDEQQYLGLYLGAGDHKWRGDASAFYLYSSVAAERIKAFCPDARILVTLRPPIEQMRSWHNDFVHGPREDVMDFHEAIRLSEPRRRGIGLPPKGVAGWMDYFGIAQYSTQVERYLHLFGPEHVKVVLLEDLAARPAETYRSILGFLDVDMDFAPEFHIHNGRPADGKLEGTLYRIHAVPGIRQLSNLIVPYRVRRRVVEKVRSLHSHEHAKRADPRDAALRERCRPDIERLAKLIDRNLSHWL